VLKQLTEEKRFARGERTGEESHEVMNLEQDEPQLEKFVQSHTVQLVTLTRQLAEYNQAEDPTLPGPFIPSRYLVNREEQRFADVDDIEQFEDDSNSTPTSMMDPEGDNDIDLLSHLEERVSHPTVEGDSEIVSVADGKTIVSTGTKKLVVPTGKFVDKSKKKSTTRKTDSHERSKQPVAFPTSPVRYTPARIVRAQLGNTMEASKPINRKHPPTIARASSTLTINRKPPPMRSVARAIPPTDPATKCTLLKLDREKQKKRHYKEMLNQSDTEEDPDESILGEPRHKKKPKHTSAKPTRTSPRKKNP
jgi:hypothetical protein